MPANRGAAFAQPRDGPAGLLLHFLSSDITTTKDLKLLLTSPAASLREEPPPGHARHCSLSCIDPHFNARAVTPVRHQPSQSLPVFFCLPLPSGF